MGITTQTERYVREVVRRVPADRRDDVGDELRSRTLWRPAGRPLVLIGPDLYPAYVRLLAILLTTVLPVVVGAFVVIDVLDGAGLGRVIGSAVGAAFTIGPQMVAWVTVGFAAAERLRLPGAATRTWTPDELPRRGQQVTRATSARVAVAGNALLIGLIVWQHVAEPYRAGGSGGRLPILDPQLWSGWIWPILAGLAGRVVLELVRLARRGWTLPLAVGYACAEVAVALPLAWVLSRQRLFNPAFLTDVNGDWSAPDAVYTLAAVGVLACGALEVVRRFRAARR